MGELEGGEAFTSLLRRGRPYEQHSRGENQTLNP